MRVVGQETPDSEAWVLADLMWVEYLRRLTRRQRQVIRLRARGYTTSEIAAQIGITPRAVRARIARARRRW